MGFRFSGLLRQAGASVKFVMLPVKMRAWQRWRTFQASLHVSVDMSKIWTTTTFLPFWVWVCLEKSQRLWSHSASGLWATLPPPTLPLLDPPPISTLVLCMRSREMESRRPCSRISHKSVRIFFKQQKRFSSLYAWGEVVPWSSAAVFFCESLDHWVKACPCYCVLWCITDTIILGQKYFQLQLLRAFSLSLWTVWGWK